MEILHLTRQGSPHPDLILEVSLLRAQIGLETSQVSFQTKSFHTSKKAWDPHQAPATCPYGSKAKQIWIPDTSKLKFILGTADAQENITICVKHLFVVM